MSSDSTRRPESALLVPTVGAVIFASDEPVDPKELAKALGELELADIEAAIDELQASLDHSASGLRVERVAGGVRLSTRSDVGAWVRQFLRQRNRTRLSPAALETLAIVAYRQPVTAPEIQAIRGRDPSASLKTLLDKKLLRLLGRKKVVGNPLLYGTSKQFLIHFGLDSLEDLPDFDDFDELVGVLDSDQAERLRGAPASGEIEMLEEIEDLEADRPIPAEVPIVDRGDDGDGG